MQFFLMSLCNKEDDVKWCLKKWIWDGLLLLCLHNSSILHVDGTQQRSTDENNTKQLTRSSFHHLLDNDHSPVEQSFALMDGQDSIRRLDAAQVMSQVQKVYGYAGN